MGRGGGHNGRLICLLFYGEITQLKYLPIPVDFHDDIMI